MYLTAILPDLCVCCCHRSRQIWQTARPCGRLASREGHDMKGDILGNALTTTMASPTERIPMKIDVHHHIFLPELSKRKAGQNAAVGWKTPEENVPWNIQKSLDAMNKLRIAGAILSYPAGIPENLVDSPFRALTCNEAGLRADNEETRKEKNRGVVRELNTHAKGLCDATESEGRFGWFACLPDLQDVEGKASIPLPAATEVQRACIRYPARDCVRVRRTARKRRESFNILRPRVWSR